MTDYGTLFVNEVALPVTAVRFRAGEAHLISEGQIPRELGSPTGLTQVRFHAPDGSVVFIAETEWPRDAVWGPVETMTVDVPVKFEGSLPGEPWATSGVLDGGITRL